MAARVPVPSLLHSPHPPQRVWVTSERRGTDRKGGERFPLRKGEWDEKRGPGF